jgi:site-specific DNA recombinase
MEKETQIKYFVYARRSIEKKDNEDRVASIESQLYEINQLAKGLKVVGTFTETKSAADPGRPQFNEMVSQIMAGKANGILCWKTDRLTRNPIDEGMIKFLLQKGIVKNIRATDRDWYSEDNGLIASVDFSMAAEYSRALSRHVKRGLGDRVRTGFRPNVAPLGYKNSKYRLKGEEEILVDEERFPKVRKLFDLMLTGQYSVPDLLKIAEKELLLTTRPTEKRPSKPMSRTNLYAIFTNYFYTSKFEYPEGSGEFYPGNHKPMITEEEFDRVQFLLGRKGRPRPKHHVFAYTGLMRCGCGARITAEEKWKHQQNGNVHRYLYYRCTGKVSPDCTEKSVEVKVLEQEIDDFLSRIEIPEEFHEWAVEELKRLHEQEKGDRNALLATHRKEYEKCISDIDKFAEMLLAEKIAPEVYKPKETELLRRKASLKRLLDGDDKRIDDWLVRLEHTLTFAQRAREEFKAGDIAKRRQILTALGTEHILKDRHIIIQTEKPLLVIQEMVSENNRVQAKLEPPKDIANKAHLKDLYPKSSLMCAGGDSNPHARTGATTSR